MQTSSTVLRIHYEQSSLNATLTEVYKVSRTLDKHSFLIAIKLKGMSEVWITDYF